MYMCFDPRPLSHFLPVGSYTHSKGIELVRKHIEAFIEKRDDGIPADRESIYLINGATEGIRVSDTGKKLISLSNGVCI